MKYLGFIFLFLVSFSVTNVLATDVKTFEPAKYAFIKPNYSLPKNSSEENNVGFDFIKSDIEDYEIDYSLSERNSCRAVRLVVEKGKRKMSLYYGDELQKTYNITLGFNPEGDKVKRGDGKTPEGLYSVSYKNNKSQYYRSFAINYPNKEDKAEAERLGVDPGDSIMIHGAANEGKFISRLKQFVGIDWTAGCVAIRDSEMDQLWQVVDVGTLVDIRP